MPTPPSDGLVAALARAQAKFKPVLKASTNPHFKSKYADLATVLDVVRPALAAEGIAVLQPVAETDRGFVLRTELRKGDEVLVSEMPLSFEGTPQQIGSALTYYRRYGLSALVCVAAEEDDDGNAAQPAPPRERAQAPRDRTNPTSAPSAKQQDTLERLMHEWVGDDLARRTQFTALVVGETDGVLSAAQCSKLIDALYRAKNGVWPDKWVPAPAGGRVDDGEEPW
jgi:hypothetical protein